jgi:hypothetical protein
MLSDGDCLQGFTVPKNRGTCLLTSHYRHWYALGRTLWARPMWGVLSSAVFQSEITSFVVDSSRSRKMILLNDVSGRFVFLTRRVCVGKLSASIRVHRRLRCFRHLTLNPSPHSSDERGEGETARRGDNVGFARIRSERGLSPIRSA